jgi:hypothetical protein
MQSFSQYQEEFVSDILCLSNGKSVTTIAHVPISPQKNKTDLIWANI